MHYTKNMGIAAPELQWVPSPTYILRRSAILDWLRPYPPGKVLEVGCGPGALLYDLTRNGYTCVGVELSPQSRSLSATLLANKTEIKIRDTLPYGNEGKFDYLFSFEVLEHIKNDQSTLIQWSTYLKPGGTVFISVPAHRHRWNDTDVAVGHYRRYNRSDVLKLLHGAGLQVKRIGTYGWPLSKIIEIIRAPIKARSVSKSGSNKTNHRLEKIELTKLSGVDRRFESRLYPLYGSILGQVLFHLAKVLQRPFYRLSLGISFLVIAKKPD